MHCLLEGREVLEEGTRKRVGNGCTINIWQDKWLLDKNCATITSRKPQGCKLEKVQELICDGKWNQILIESVFSDEDFKRIGDIPLSMTGYKDRLIWTLSKSGQYTVKTGYLVAKDLNKRKAHLRQRMGENSRNEEGSGLWKFLWGLNIKHKIKHFVWKCLHKILPVNEVVKSRTGRGNETCHCCGDQTETIEHMLFYCQHARLIWKAAPIQWDGLEQYQQNFWHWWASLTEAQERTDGKSHIALTANILWQIWKSRNQMHFNQEGRNPVMAMNKAMQEWLEYKEINEGTGINADTGGKAEKEHKKWIPPPHQNI